MPISPPYESHSPALMAWNFCLQMDQVETGHKLKKDTLFTELYMGYIILVDPHSNL